jgi:hypothetical protein
MFWVGGTGIILLSRVYISLSVIPDNKMSLILFFSPCPPLSSLLCEAARHRNNLLDFTDIDVCPKEDNTWNLILR